MTGLNQERAKDSGEVNCFKRNQRSEIHSCESLQVHKQCTSSKVAVSKCSLLLGGASSEAMQQNESLKVYLCVLILPDALLFHLAS